MKQSVFLLLAGVLVTALSLAGCISSKERNDAKVHYTLGLSYLRESNNSSALKEFLQAVELNPEDANIHLALGQTYQVMKAHPDAERSYKTAISLSRDSVTPLAQNNLASLYLDMGRWDDAIRFFRIAADNLLFQSPEVAHAGIGYALFNKKDYLTAVSEYKRALDINPQYALAHLRLAEVYEALGKPDLVVNEYVEVLKVAPENVQMLYKLGIAAARVGKKAQAINAFREIIRIDPQSAEAKLAQDNIKLLQ